MMCNELMFLIIHNNNLQILIQVFWIHKNEKKNCLRPFATTKIVIFIKILFDIAMYNINISF